MVIDLDLVTHIHSLQSSGLSPAPDPPVRLSWKLANTEVILKQSSTASERDKRIKTKFNRKR
jgi:hypothetical protein